MRLRGAFLAIYDVGLFGTYCRAFAKASLNDIYYRCLTSTYANASARVFLSSPSSSPQKPDQAVLGARNDMPAMLGIGNAHIFAAETVLEVVEA